MTRWSLTIAPLALLLSQAACTQAPPPAPPDNPGDPDNRWGIDAAQTAFILLRRPVRVAIHARTMLPPEAA